MSSLQLRNLKVLNLSESAFAQNHLSTSILLMLAVRRVLSCSFQCFRTVFGWRIGVLSNYEFYENFVKISEFFVRTKHVGQEFPKIL
jgi:hypothetical protein